MATQSEDSITEELSAAEMLDDPIGRCLQAIEKKHNCDREEAIRITAGRLGMETGDRNRRAIFYALELEAAPLSPMSTGARAMLLNANEAAAARGEEPLYQVEIMKESDAYEDLVMRVEVVAKGEKWVEFCNTNTNQLCEHAANVVGKWLQNVGQVSHPRQHAERVASELVTILERKTTTPDAELIIRHALVGYGVKQKEVDRLRDAYRKRHR